MVSNEDLAMKAKQGDREAMCQLWEQTHKLLFKLVSRYFPFCKRSGLEPEDLVHSGYFALVHAVAAYAPEKGYAFNSYLEFHVANAARDALGFRDGRRTPPPYVRSLDEPLPGVEDGNLTLGDSLVDESAEAAVEQVQDHWQKAQLRECLEQCMRDMDPDQAGVIHARYFENKTLQAIADETNSNRERVRQLEAKALRQLRRPHRARQLRAFMFYDDTHGTGLRAFRNRGYVSKVEVLAGVY